MDERQRQNLLLMASLCVRGTETCPVRVRNISRGGVKVTGPVVPAGALVRIQLPNLGWLSGTVAWTSEDDFGIRLLTAIDPAAVRKPVTGAYVRPEQRELRRVA
jgi:hypothetical protein